MDMGKRGFITEYKQIFSQRWGNLWEIPRNYKKIWLRELTVAIKQHIFSQRWGNLWEIPGNYKNIWLIEVTVARKHGTWIRDRYTSGGGAI